MDEIKDPHFALPFRIEGADAAVVNGGSDAEVLQNVDMIMRYQRGERIDDPDFGIAEPNFRENGVDLDDLRSAIDQGEPRAREVIERDPDALANLIDDITIRGSSSG